MKRHEVAELFESLRRVARSGQVGQPVFLRCQVTGPPERAVTVLAEALAAAEALFDDTAETLQAAGDEAAGALHAVLIFRSGSTVLAYTGPGEEAVDVMLLGNHGAAYGPAVPVPPHPRSAGFLTTGMADESALPFVALIQRSLSTRQPVRWEAGRDA
jgi:hypothetical protein